MQFKPYQANIKVQCPQCGEDIEAKVLVDPGEEAVYYPPDLSTPGYPPEVIRISSIDYCECRDAFESEEKRREYDAELASRIFEYEDL